MAFLNYRDQIRLISPRWLRNGFAEKLLYTIGLHCDALADWVSLGVRRRMPNLDSDDSLPQIGSDRKMRRGRTEDPAIYAARLDGWLDAHRHRGGPYALLQQIHAHYAAAPFAVTLEYPSGLKFTMDPTGAITWDLTGTWPPGTPGWSQWLLTYQWPTPLTGAHLWGDGHTWGDGSVWGSDLEPADIADLRLIPQEWNAAHCIGKLWLTNAGTTVKLDIPNTG